MSERAANLFLYLENGVIKSLGAVAHDLDGDDSQILTFLRDRVAIDASLATRYPLPVADIRSWLGIDAEQGLLPELYSYIRRVGKALWLFDGPLQAIGVPQRPLVCITMIVDGKAQIGVVTHVDSSSYPMTLFEEFNGLVKRIDWLAAYITLEGLNVHDLLGDDFTDAIKLLYANRHYVSAMKLIVSFIDTVAYLDLGDIPNNYQKWLSKYATLASVGVTPSELWEFRNAILHMTNSISRKVQSGNVYSLVFCVGSSSRAILIDRESGTKMFSFEMLYETVIEALDTWTKSYSDDLSRQLEFIKRYDTILSEKLIARFTPCRRVPRGEKWSEKSEDRPL